MKIGYVASTETIVVDNSGKVVIQPCIINDTRLELNNTALRKLQYLFGIEFSDIHDLDFSKLKNASDLNVIATSDDVNDIETYDGIDNPIHIPVFYTGFYPGDVYDTHGRDYIDEPFGFINASRTRDGALWLFKDQSFERDGIQLDPVIKPVFYYKAEFDRNGMMFRTPNDTYGASLKQKLQAIKNKRIIVEDGREFSYNGIRYGCKITGDRADIEVIEL